MTDRCRNCGRFMSAQDAEEISWCVTCAPPAGEIPQDEKRVVAHPADEASAQRQASCLGLPLQTHDSIPKGTAYIFDPTRLFDDDSHDKTWPNSIVRINYLDLVPNRRYPLSVAVVL